MCFAIQTLTFAQDDDLLSILGEEETTEYIDAAFKTNRVINGHSIENTAEGVLDFKISHRFGMLNTGFYELFGLDNAMIRFGFDYGITDQLTIGGGRSSFRKMYDAFAKYKFLRQSRGKKNMPVSAAWVVAFDFQGTKNNPDPENKMASRFAWTHQLIVGSKLSEAFSLQLTPTYVHRNLVDFNEKNDVFGIGLAARQKLSKWVAVTFEYYLMPGNQLPDGKYDSFSIGFDIETGGHVFQLHFTNSTGMSNRGYLTETTGNWGDGGVHFGFNVSRVFTLKERGR
ncbi:MAG: hypothetical protein D6714_06285 [Bacteroidetes bacterium]|nr:MAG: hypothetical protein D6714_06285 [Bacteroidota bacterium]